MGKNDKPSLSWDDFRALGNPDNAPEEEQEEQQIDPQIPIRIHLEKKHRGGKTASIVRGLEDEESELLKSYCKDIKQQCGVGGNAKHGEIIIQGNHRTTIEAYFKALGYKNVKLSGA